jgi:hypothetical protein
VPGLASLLVLRAKRARGSRGVAAAAGGIGGSVSAKWISTSLASLRNAYLTLPIPSIVTPLSHSPPCDSTHHTL